MYSDELMHYGVKGMRWGVRRATKALSKATTDEQREKAVNRLNKHRDKASRKIEKLDKARPKLERRVEKAITKNDVRATELNSKAVRLQKRANGLFVSDAKAMKRLQKANLLESQAKALAVKSNEAKAKLAQNEAMTKAFKQGINDIDDALVEYGRKYVRG